MRQLNCAASAATHLPGTPRKRSQCSPQCQQGRYTPCARRLPRWCLGTQHRRQCRRLVLSMLHHTVCRPSHRQRCPLGISCTACRRLAQQSLGSTGSRRRSSCYSPHRKDRKRCTLTESGVSRHSLAQARDAYSTRHVVRQVVEDQHASRSVNNGDRASRKARVIVYAPPGGGRNLAETVTWLACGAAGRLRLRCQS